VTGKVAEAALGRAGITVNKNAIPFDQNPPMTASGVRIGTPAVTTRGLKEPEMDKLAGLIARVLGAPTTRTSRSRCTSRSKDLPEFPAVSRSHGA
jgi:glycine hydroxymethyltransferase